MSSDSQDPQPPAASVGRRRSSFAEMFARQPAIDVAAANSGRTNAMAQAMAQQQQQQQQSRRLSVSALGLSGSPTRASTAQTAFESLKDKSLASRPRGSSVTVDETAVEDGDAVAPLTGDTTTSRPTSPSIARRMSFGAMGHRESIRASSGSSNTDSALATDGGGASPGGSTSPPSSARKEGFNWSENLRTRAQRTSISFSQGTGGYLPLTSGGSGVAARPRAAPGPAASTPAPATKMAAKTPDHFQERILKGDFYMD